MDFLDTIYFDNTIRAWLMVGGIILLALLLKKYVSRYIASLLYRLMQRIWKTVEKKSFVDLVLAPLQLFLLTLITVFSIDKLNFPSIARYSIYHINTQVIIERTGITVIILVFTWLLLRLIDFIALVLEEQASFTEDKSDDQLIVFFRDFLKVILSIAGVLLLLKFTLGQNIGNLLTGLSIVGAALALAARESLENIIASFIIFFDKPFVTGDTLKVQQVIGAVERIGLRSTRIRTADKTLVSVPNKQMVDSIVDNWSMRTERRAEIRLELAVKTPASKLEIVIEALKKILAAYTEELSPYNVILTDISKNGLVILIEYYTASLTLNEFDTLRQTINLQIKKLLEDNEIAFANETNTLVINNDFKEN